MGERHYQRRIQLQADLLARKIRQNTGLLLIEKIIPLHATITKILRLSGLTAKARQNCLDVEVVHREVFLPRLPAVFEGFRLLHLSDLHCDLLPEIVDVVGDLAGATSYDACVITGDYHDRVGRCHGASLALMARLVSRLNAPIFGILGNHDMIEKTGPLESCGIRVLLNEGEAIQRAGERFWICGIDDPHFFRTHDLPRARVSVGPDETAILLSHSPESFREAESLGYDLLLCGHTHSGQICLPGGFPIVRNARVPLRLIGGEWRHGNLSGYTSRGTGSCGVPVRFHCRPEITIHILRKGNCEAFCSTRGVRITEITS